LSTLRALAVSRYGAPGAALEQTYSTGWPAVPEISRERRAARMDRNAASPVRRVRSRQPGGMTEAPRRCHRRGRPAEVAARPPAQTREKGRGRAPPPGHRRVTHPPRAASADGSRTAPTGRRGGF
jgi:hypothetical protein